MLKNMKIGKRLIISFVLVGLMASIAGVVGVFILRTVDSAYGKALVENGFVLGDIGDYNANLNKGGALVRDIINLTDAADIKSAQAELEEVKKLTQEALDRATLRCATPAEVEILDKINAAAPKYQEGREKAIALGIRNENEEAMQVFLKEARPYLLECASGGAELMALNVKMGNEVSTQLSSQAVTFQIIMWAVIVVALIIATIFAVIISNGISKPVAEIEAAAKEMANGDYDVEITYESKDEVGSLSASMRQMISITKDVVTDTARGLNEIANGNFDIAPKAEYVGVFAGVKNAIVQIITDLSETMAQIKIASDQVSSGSDQVSSGAQALAQGATEQASSVQELSASITEVSQQIQKNAENSQDANAAAGAVAGKIDTSNEQMAQMLSAMSDISNSSMEISKIIKTIEDIAFQTNILALNAAVEAARAGAAGKGFAVVADEVRNLATKSSEAAKQTNVLIEGSVKSVENGVSIANATSQSLADVVTGAQEITSLIGQISVASGEQSTSIAQINLGVEQISSVVQTNSATSEESAAASEELNGQANMMRELVSKFVLFGASKNKTQELEKPLAVTHKAAAVDVEFTGSKY
ncbi:MAG: methyl-accepting chemotaxis protein [Oscillospiraceae bacterium]